MARFAAPVFAACISLIRLFGSGLLLIAIRGVISEEMLDERKKGATIQGIGLPRKRRRRSNHTYTLLEEDQDQSEIKTTNYAGTQNIT